MVSIHSDEEQDFVVGLNADGYPWLGGKRDPDYPDNFLWSDGTPWDYTIWTDGQPDNAGGVEDCVTMWESEDHKWNDLTCSNRRSSVCKKEQMSRLSSHIFGGRRHYNSDISSFN